MRSPKSRAGKRAFWGLCVIENAENCKRLLEAVRPLQWNTDCSKTKFRVRTRCTLRSFFAM